MSKFDHAYSVRESVIHRLEEDLLGGDLDAEISESPLDRFITGVLYPEAEDPGLAATPASVEDEREGDREAEIQGNVADGNEAPGVALSKVRFPRSFGVTFAVDAASAATVEVSLSAAQYEEQTAEKEKTAKAEPLWVRKPLEPKTEHLDCSLPGVTRREIADDLELSIVVRDPRDGSISVTLSLINNATAPHGKKDAKCWFDPRMVVTAASGVLRSRPPLVQAGDNDGEKESQRLLHRETATYAVGHGCAASWSADDHGAVVKIESTFVPRHELLLSKASGGQALGMMELARDNGNYRQLQSMIDSYRQWIDQLGTTGLDDSEAETLARHQSDAREAADRMRAGLELLRSDSDVRRSFTMMNTAMAEQRSRQEFHRDGNEGNPSSADLMTAQWRPFQMAFILTNLRGLADGDHPDRKLADLLWFPTGGGKTEAYLGIIGVAILLRRLRNPEAGGVSVLMRYTLRLLTLQQYQRATGLICALEKVRHEELSGTQPISIGLWVGEASTPNSVAGAKAFLNRVRKGSTPRENDEDTSDPRQLRQCPWCGRELGYEHYGIVQDSWMKVACKNADCFYRNGLPVHIIDADVYRERPSLVIATVDKFALLPWKKEVGNLLGAGYARGDTPNPPPDLIVQDELHLISGPLGTMVGLYETAIDSILSQVHPPKIVASTATIRRASQQVKAVFARESRQFPPPGLTQTDSFFAEQASRDEMGSREYVGLMAPGASHATLMVRAYASLLQSAASIAETDEGADLYWTLLGYFNSLRVLGGAYIQVLDDVPDQMGVIARRRDEQIRDRPEIREMTSRKKSSEIPHELEVLATKRGSADAADVVLATNMISVGVDVDRLGLMTMMGQPPTSSEYIQATSRVGRRMPGLVVTLYNAARSRDLSHYENFTAYHQMLYLHVEATGATPFAPRARDRALHSVLVALARHTIYGAGSNKNAANASQWVEELDAVAQIIVDRAEATREPGEFRPDDESAARIKSQLQDLIIDWSEADDLQHYEGWFGKTAGALLVEANRMLSGKSDAVEMQFPPQAPPWPTLTSMRDVDAESSLFLLGPRRRSSRG